MGSGRARTGGAGACTHTTAWTAVSLRVHTLVDTTESVIILRESAIATLGGLETVARNLTALMDRFASSASLARASMARARAATGSKAGGATSPCPCMGWAVSTPAQATESAKMACAVAMPDTLAPIVLSTSAQATVPVRATVMAIPECVDAIRGGLATTALSRSATDVRMANV